MEGFFDTEYFIEDYVNRKPHWRGLGKSPYIVKTKMCSQSSRKSVGISFPYLSIFFPADTFSAASGVDTNTAEHILVIYLLR